MEQTYRKAKIVMESTDDFRQIKKIYRDKKKNILLSQLMLIPIVIVVSLAWFLLFYLSMR